MYQPSGKNHTLVVQLAEIWIKLNHMPPQVFTLQEDMESFAFPDRINLISTSPQPVMSQPYPVPIPIPQPKSRPLPKSRGIPDTLNLDKKRIFGIIKKISMILSPK